MPRKHSHYFRPIAHLREIDIYRFLDLFNVTDHALGHAIKKLVVPGMRGGGKPARKDIEEAIETLQRRLEMMDEDAAVESAGAVPYVGPERRAAAVAAHGEPRPMIPWDGTRQTPFPMASRLVEAMQRDGVIVKHPSDDLQWRWAGRQHRDSDIVGYWMPYGR